MKAHRAAHSIATLCRVLEVSPSGYYAWHHRTPSPRAQEDASLTAEIEAIHTSSRGTYGGPADPRRAARAGPAHQSQAGGAPDACRSVAGRQSP